MIRAREPSFGIVSVLRTRVLLRTIADCFWTPTMYTTWRCGFEYHSRLSSHFRCPANQNDSFRCESSFFVPRVADKLFCESTVISSLDWTHQRTSNVSSECIVQKTRLVVRVRHQPTSERKVRI